MAGRFPGAPDIEQFWANLRDGVESISFFTDDELLASGVEPELLRDPSYVKARPIMGGIDLFDAGFFGLSPREAEVLDPQQRVFLECAWQALEVAGYAGKDHPCRVGVYAGSTISTYMLQNLYGSRAFRASIGLLQMYTANDKDYLSTRTSYKLGLTGPSISVNCACSTSLVAVCVAARALIDGECDIALAGGVNVTIPEKTGYLYQRGSILSPDGHCRAFDHRAQGTIFGDGIGIVALKRLEDALEDGDNIDAVVLGAAVNNDGSAKVGFTAPSPTGQAEVVERALAIANVRAETITYVEAHGTGTALGDPVEIAGLTQAFRKHTSASAFCAIGSVKTNVGHLSTAAGIAGFIKTLLALKHRKIPPSLHFETPNPEIDFASTPFFVNSRLTNWNGPGPLRAGVSSFGIGGTNAHVIVEQPPHAEPTAEPPSWQLLTLSAKSEGALESATTNVVHNLQQQPDAGLANVAFTLQRGRGKFSHRRAIVARTGQDAANAVGAAVTSRVRTGVVAAHRPSVVFMFPGQGAQYAGMAAGLYRAEPCFRATVDECVETLALPQDFRATLSCEMANRDHSAALLKQTAYAQPALFVVEYALARLLMSWGLRPDAMIGHSIGEYVAACLAGVLTPQDALTLVATRGRLMQRLPAGAMLAVNLAEDELRPLLDGDLCLATVNAARMCVVSGTSGAITQFEQRMRQRQIALSRLQTSHAFHSSMMDPIRHRIFVECNRHLDHRRRGDRSGLLGQTSARHGAVRCRRTGTVARSRSRFPGSGARRDAYPVGRPACRGDWGHFDAPAYQRVRDRSGQSAQRRGGTLGARHRGRLGSVACRQQATPGCSADLSVRAQALLDRRWRADYVIRRGRGAAGFRHH
jgi:acyl transferase domain-containing protein